MEKHIILSKISGVIIELLRQAQDGDFDEVSNTDLEAIAGAEARKVYESIKEHI